MGKLFQDSGSTSKQKTEEAIRIHGILHRFPVDYDQLKQKDRDFLKKMTEKLNTYGTEAFVSTQELFWLRDIKERLLG